MKFIRTIVQVVLPILLSWLFSLKLAFASPQSHALPLFPPCDPESQVLGEVMSGEPSPQFCSKWNPDFPNNGYRCCGNLPARRRRPLKSLKAKRPKGNFCAEMTEEQKEYSDAAGSGKLGDLLNLITQEIGTKGEQSYCTVNNGFLAHGRRVIGTTENRIQVRSADRCLDFGTDEMVGMLEWLGREVGKQFGSQERYSGVNLVVGEVSAPRGGAILNPSGRRRHMSHTSGQDADLGFLTVKEGQRSPAQFHRSFDSLKNWWMIQQIFKNPFACVKVVFLDRHHIRSLAKVAKNDERWGRF